MLLENEKYVAYLKRITELEFTWDRLCNASILVTGAAGLIGSLLVDALVFLDKKDSRNLSLYVVGRSKEKMIQRFSSYCECEAFHLIEADINDKEMLCKKLGGVKMDFIFHLASNTHPKDYAEDPIGTILTSITGTSNILEYAAKHHTKKVVFTSSVEIYGENRNDVEYFAEEDCGYINSNTLRAGYPEGKRAAEALCQAYIDKYGLDIVIARLSRVYGPTMLQSDTKVMSQFIKNVLQKEDIVLKSSGNQQFSYCYVFDAVTALFYIFYRGECGSAYNVADPKSNVSLKELATFMAGINNKRVTYRLPGKVEQKGFSKATKALLNATKLQQIGWSAEYDIYQGIKETIELCEDLWKQ